MAGSAALLMEGEQYWELGPQTFSARPQQLTSLYRV
jgi:hypothetical protein